MIQKKKEDTTPKAMLNYQKKALEPQELTSEHLLRMLRVSKARKTLHLI